MGSGEFGKFFRVLAVLFIEFIGFRMLAMYFERLNSGLPLYETIGRTGMLALCIFGRP